MYNTVKIETVINGASVPYTAIVFVHGNLPMLKTCATIKEAKRFCADQSEFEDDAWVILDNGRVVASGIIEGMFEEG